MDVLIRTLAIVVLAFSTATLAADAPTPGELARPGVHAELELTGCSRAMLFEVTRIEVAERIDARRDNGGDDSRDKRDNDRGDDRDKNREPPPGHRWLVVDVEVENRMPADLMFDLDYNEELLVASVPRQMYLLINDRLVSRSVAELNTLKPNFILPYIGATESGRVVYPLPEDDIESLSLRYYHDQYAPVVVHLAGSEPLPVDESIAVRSDGSEGPAGEPQRNDVLELAVAGRTRESSWQGVAAPEGMQWLVVELVGRSFWTLAADALALDRDADIDARVELPKVMEYVKAAGLLQVVVDGRHGYTRELTLGNLPAEPAVLPDAWAGGLAVFPIPADAGRVELAVHYPLFQGEGIEDGIPETMRFELFDEADSAQSNPGPAPSELLVIEDDPTPLTIHRTALIERFGRHTAGEGRALLRLDASMRNTSPTGGMMGISERLSLSGPDGEPIELLGAYLRGPLTLEEPFWLPAGGEPRAFSLVYDVPESLDAAELAYGGVSINTREQLAVEAP